MKDSEAAPLLKSGESTVPYWSLLVIFAAALLARLWYTFQVEASPFSSTLIIDALDEDRWGREIASGDWFGRERGVFYRDPLYAYLLGAVYSLAGHSLEVVRLIQAFFDSLACILLFFVGKRLFGISTGLVTALMAALYGPFVFHQNLIMKTSATIFFLAAFTAVALSALERPVVKRWFLAGMLLGLASLTRGNLLLFAPLTAVTFLAVSRRSTLKTHIVCILFFAIGLAVVLLPVAARNRVYGGAFVVTVPSVGINFYHGSNPSSGGVHSKIPGVQTIPGREWEDSRRVASQRAGRELTPTEVSDFWMREGIRFIRNEPFKYLKLLSRKSLLFWNHFEVPDVYNYYYFREMPSLLSVLAAFSFLGPLGIAGVALSLGRSKGARLMAGAMAAYMASVVFFYITSRYRLPLMVFLLPFSAFTVVSLWNALRARELKRLTLILVILVPAAVVVNLPILKGAPFLSQSRTLLGNIHYSEGRRGEAVDEYRTAVEIDRRNSIALNNLAFAYFEEGGRLQEALSLAEESIEIYPYSLETFKTLAVIFAELGRYGEAENAVSRAVSIDATDPELEEISRRIAERRR